MVLRLGNPVAPGERAVTVGREVILGLTKPRCPRATSEVGVSDHCPALRSTPPGFGDATRTFDHVMFFLASEFWQQRWPHCFTAHCSACQLGLRSGGPGALSPCPSPDRVPWTALPLDAGGSRPQAALLQLQPASAEWPQSESGTPLCPHTNGRRTTRGAGTASHP